MTRSPIHARREFRVSVGLHAIIAPVRDSLADRSVEAFEEMYCRISALELLVMAMAQQLDRDRFARDLRAHREKLLATAAYSSLSKEVAERLTSHIDRYARLMLVPSKTGD